jgi:riboflavin kinase/FMN adenylyltransferase
MNVIAHAIKLAPSSRKVCLAIGVFDGVHLGHEQVIRQTVSDAQQHEGVAVVITFDRHPNEIVAPARVPPLIYSLPQKLRVIESLGAETTLLIRFDQAFSEIPAEIFIRDLARDFKNVHSICVGSQFTFGHKRSGNVALLKELGQELKFVVHGLAAVALDGEIVSSTRIREAIREGNLDDATQMLGRAYALSGQVVRGDQLGRKLGFPTANLDVAGLALPPTGVYAVHAAVRGKIHRAVLNIGFRPTLGNPKVQPRVEAHLLDFSEDVYQQEMEIGFVEKLRDEKQFPSLDELKKQIARDIADAEKRF